MKVSVLIPSYRPGEYVFECLESVCNQTLSKDLYEVVLVLNGCNEPYYSQIKAFQEKNKTLNLKLIQTDTPGVSNARNVALDNAQGEYIAFLDDDDMISESYLEELLKISSKEVVGLPYAVAFRNNIKEELDYRITIEYHKFCNKTGFVFYKPKKFFSNVYVKLIHNSIIDGRRFDVNFKIGEDSLFMFLISNKIKSVAFTSKNAVYYRRFREGSAFHTKRSKKEQFINVCRLLLTYTKYYLNPKERNYKFFFYLTRMLAAVKTLFIAKL